MVVGESLRILGEYHTNTRDSSRIDPPTSTMEYIVARLVIARSMVSPFSSSRSRFPLPVSVFHELFPLAVSLDVIRVSSVSLGSSFSSSNHRLASYSPVCFAFSTLTSNLPPPPPPPRLSVAFSDGWYM